MDRGSRSPPRPLRSRAVPLRRNLLPMRLAIRATRINSRDVIDFRKAAQAAFCLPSDQTFGAGEIFSSSPVLHETVYEISGDTCSRFHQFGTRLFPFDEQ